MLTKNQNGMLSQKANAVLNWMDIIFYEAVFTIEKRMFCGNKASIARSNKHENISIIGCLSFPVVLYPACMLPQSAAVLSVHALLVNW